MIRNDDNPTTSQDNSLAPVRKPTGAVVISNNGGGSFRRDKAANGVANLDGFLHALRRTWLWCLLLGVVTGGVAAAGVWWHVQDEYTAVAELRVRAIPPRVLNSGSMQPVERFELYVSNIQQLLQSRQVISTALRNATEVLNKTTPESLQPIRDEKDDPDAWLLSRLRIANPKNSEILTVAVTVPDQNLAKELANQVVKAYLTEIHDKELLAKNENLEELKNVLSEKTLAERQARETLEELLPKGSDSTDAEVLTLDQQTRLMQSQLVKSELAKTRIQRMRIEADVKTLEKRLAVVNESKIPADELELLTSSNPEARVIKEEIDALQSQLEKTGSIASSTGKNGTFSSSALMTVRQRVKDLSNKLSGIQDRLATSWRIDQRRTIQASIDASNAESEALAGLEEQLKGDATKYDDEAGEIGEKAGKAVRASYQIAMQNKEVERQSEFVDKVAREKEYEEIESKSGKRIHISSEAISPKFPNRPGRVVKAAQAGLAGFLLPGVLIVLLDVRSKRVNSVKEVQDQLGLPVFGSVPMLPSQVTRRLGGTSRKGRRWQALLSESVNGIRANLLRLGDVRVVMVTSSVGGEGKTTVATQLAMSLARIGKRTALVDFDLPRPALNNVFGLPLEPGICDVLRNDYRLDEIVHEVALPNLSIITSGIADASSSRYMNSARLAEVLDELREQYDYVIVDGSPLIPVADARVVSRYVDGAICCVLRDVSRLGLIQQATEILSTFNVRLLGTVVTAKQDTFYLSPQGDRESQLAAPKPR